MMVSFWVGRALRLCPRKTIAYLGAVLFIASFASFCRAFIFASRRLDDALPRALSDSIT